MFIGAFIHIVQTWTKGGPHWEGVTSIVTLVTIAGDFLDHVARRVAEFEPWPDSEVLSIHHVQEHPPDQTRSLYRLHHHNESCRESRKREPAHSASSATDTGHQGTIGE